ncbi:MAG: prepilin-type N-terminal cleavage/methylation domain-containing protein [bacterium]|nr:prepilin-type N-terminal cleavage/methylation domain-containing protein [bacterium]
MTKNKGFTIIEILIVITIAGISFSALLGLAAFSLKNSVLIKETYQANYLAQEMLEIARNLRDGTDWGTGGIGSFSADVAFHPEKTAASPPKWQLISGTETTGIFSRNLVFKRVSRDANDNIEEVFNPANEDANTRKAIATASWNKRGIVHKVELFLYLTNWKQ